MELWILAALCWSGSEIIKKCCVQIMTDDQYSKNSCSWISSQLAGLINERWHVSETGLFLPFWKQTQVMRVSRNDTELTLCLVIGIDISYLVGSLDTFYSGDSTDPARNWEVNGSS